MNFVRYHFLGIDSTNTWASENVHLLDPAKMTIVTAERQYQGRGRFKRAWESPPNVNLYATFCFFVLPGQKDLAAIGLVMGSSFAAVMETFGLSAKLKWPNDLILNGKKVGGILCEMRGYSDKICVIAGAGINVNMPLALLEKIDRPATSLMVETGEQIDIEAFLQTFQRQFQKDLALFLSEGFAPFHADFSKRLLYQAHEPIRVRDGKNVFEGTFEAVCPDGSLSLKLPTGEVKKVSSGEVEEAL